jgi:uncharacterized protein (TIGR02594 family)
LNLRNIFISHKDLFHSQNIHESATSSATFRWVIGDPIGTPSGLGEGDFSMHSILKKFAMLFLATTIIGVAGRGTVQARPSPYAQGSHWQNAYDFSDTSRREARRSKRSARQVRRGHGAESAHARSHRASKRVRIGARHIASLQTSESSGGGYGGGSVVSEARRWIGTNPTGRSSLWCARFMNFVLNRTGHSGTGSDLARSFASYGSRLSGPQVGAIAVMGRRGGGHVGVVSGIDSSGNPIVISGNHGRRVAEAVYPRGRIYAYVMPR